MSRTARPLRFLALAGLLACAPTPARAQAVSVGAGGGVALPTGGAGDFRAAGPFASASVGYDFGPRWGVRLEAEWARLPGGAAPPANPSWRYGTLRARGAALAAVWRPTDAAAEPYLLLGAGAYSLRIDGRGEGPYGTTPGLVAGAGLHLPGLGRVRPFAEARLTVHATDYGSDEMHPVVYWPIVVGVRL